MNYLSVENVSKSFGDNVLFDNLSFGINQGQKIALIAKNGSGKTTLLNIVAGLDAPDKGEVIKRKNIQIAYLSQKEFFDNSLTVEQTVLATENRILSIVKNYEKALKNPEDSESYQKAFDLMEQHNAWDFEIHFKFILSKLKLNELSKKVAVLSGGQRKRLRLAILLINKPDLLILDEPTNHLDLEMIEWLEAYLIKEKITLFMVTHDRYFIENICNQVIELDRGVLHKYKGNYSNYLEKKEQRVALETTLSNKAKSVFKKELEWMRKQPKARTAKSKSRIDDFLKIKEKANQRRQDHKIQLEINTIRLGSKILELHKVKKSFGDLKILDGFEYVFKKGERIGIVGKNGTGKSSFLNLITKKESVDGGKVVVGETVKFGYYTQQGITVEKKQKVIEVIKNFGEQIPLTKGRRISASQLLERFLFDKKKQYDFVEKLSGGEQKRLYLCTVLIQNPNFLILDEPTNDLDILTLSTLESFLLDFPGNLMVVSHDRYFMDKIVDSLFVFRGNGIVEIFPGNYTDFRTYEDARSKERTLKSVNKHLTSQSKKSLLSNKEKRTLDFLDRDIERLAREKKSIEDFFMKEGITQDQMIEKSAELQKIASLLDEKEEEWLKISLKLEE